LEWNCKLDFEYQKKQIDLSKWEVVSFADLMKTQFGITPDEDHKVWLKKLEAKGIKIESGILSRTQIINIIGDLVEPKAGNHPVFVNRLDGHVAVANSLALRLAGINKDTPVPDGGFIECDGSGEPIGILKDNALELVTRHIPAPPDSVRLQAISAALQHAAQLGITSVQDVSPVNDFQLYQQLARQGKLTCRINAVMPVESHTTYLKQVGVEYHYGSPLLRIGSVKCFSDGSMGAGSALLFEPYTDDGTTSGLAIHPKSKLMKLIAAAHKNNLQVYCHAIGDKANRWVLDAFEAAVKKYGRKDLRHRIEHAQLVAQDDFQRADQWLNMCLHEAEYNYYVNKLR